MTRRLAAILAADVVGYSAMMGADEQDTLNQLIAFRKSVFDPLVTKHNGRVVKLTGDGALVEFVSVHDATTCAIAIQSAIAAGGGPITLRIGLNLGDIIEEGKDIYGDGVNIAARLEALADPGGVCISGIVRHCIGNRIDAFFEDGGSQSLKNIAAPVQVFHWRPSVAAQSIGAAPDEHAEGKSSIVVLAFDNMSTDPEQEYFSDGLAEDIITALSYFREFFVIARNTAFAYKGQAIRVDQVCRDLGVRYLLEGSVRKAGNRVRVTAQLIDGETGAHIWANKYDRELHDLFAFRTKSPKPLYRPWRPKRWGQKPSAPARRAPVT